MMSFKKLLPILLIVLLAGIVWAAPPPKVDFERTMNPHTRKLDYYYRKGINASTTLPASCRVGDIYWDEDADTDGALYVCKATDTWKAAGGVGAMTLQAVTDIGATTNQSLTTGGLTSDGNIFINDNYTLTLSGEPVNETGIIFLNDFPAIYLNQALNAGASNWARLSIYGPLGKGSGIACLADVGIDGSGSFTPYFQFVADYVTDKVIFRTDREFAPQVNSNMDYYFEFSTTADVPKLDCIGGSTCEVVADLTGNADTSSHASDLSIASEAAGDIIYFDGANWVRLAGSGTNTWVLAYNTATNVPYWKADDDSGGAPKLNEVLDPDGDTSFTMGNNEIKFLFGGNDDDHNFELDVTGNSSGDVLHVHQHTGSPGGGNLIHAEAEHENMNPLVHIGVLAVDTTVSDIVGLLIDTDVDDDADFIPIEVRDDRGINNDLLFRVAATGQILSDSLTASEIVITDASKNIISAAVATYPSLTELSYVKGLSSAVQTQLDTVTDNSIADTLHRHTELVSPNGSIDPVLSTNNNGRVGIGTASPGEALEMRVVAPLIRLRATGSTASDTAAYVEFGGTTATNFNRTGYVGDSTSGDTHIRLVAEDSDLILRAENGDLILGDSSSETVLTLSGGDVIIAGNIKGLPQPLRFNLPMPKDFYDNVDHEVLIWRQVDADITITLIECSLDASGNELNFDLMYADAFIGFGGATRIDTLDTTSGVFSETSSFENATVAAGKDIYFLLDATPHEDITQVVCYIKYDYD